MTWRRDDETPIDHTAGWVIDDVPPAQADTFGVRKTSVRAGHGASPPNRGDPDWRRGRRASPERTDQRRGVLVDEPGNGTEYGRIGRRGWLRPEIVALLLGVAFVAAALIKPWPSAPRQESIRGQATPVVVSVASAAPTPTPTIDIYALIPPYNYRPGQWPPPHQSAASPAAEATWAAMDWSFLTQLDGHSSWGVAAVTLSSLPPGAASSAPVVNWVQEVAPWSPSNLFVPHGSAAYALALTWPSDIRVESISFDYLSYESPRVGVTPVPAAAVATPPPGFPAPEKATTSASPGRTLGPNGGSMVSGAFWIPPSSDLTEPAPGAVRTIWQAAPWAWPTGSYRVTLHTNAGEMIVVLSLRGL